MSSLSSPRRSPRLTAKYGRRVEYPRPPTEKYDGLPPQSSRHLFLLHKSPTDSNESFSGSFAAFSEYTRNIRNSEFRGEKAIHMFAFLRFLKDAPRFLAMNPSIVGVTKQLIADFKNEQILVSDPVLAAKLLQRLDDIAYILADGV